MKLFNLINNSNKFMHLIDEKWHVQGINGVPLFIHSGPYSGLIGIKKSLGFNYKRFMMVYKKDFCEMYYNRKDVHFVCDKFIEKYKNDNNYTQMVWDKSQKEFKQFIDLTEGKPNKKRFEEMSKKDFLDETKKVFVSYYNCFATSHLLEGFSLSTDVLIKDMFLKELAKLGKEKEYTKYFSQLFLPTKKSFNMEMNNQLHFILKLIRQNSELDILFKSNNVEDVKVKIKDKLELMKLLNKFVSDFYWIKGTWGKCPDYSINELIKDLKEYVIKDDHFDFTSKEDLENNKEKIKKLKDELNLSEELRMYLDLTEFVSYWQDDRKVKILKGAWIVDKYAYALANKLNMKVENVKYLVPEEFDNLNNISEDELSKRREASVYLFNDQDLCILSGSDFNKFEMELEKHKHDDDMKEFSGMCASIGKTIGRVHVCLTPDKIAEVQDGDILVTTMTRPEFLPAMKKSSAVITDEGGLTCHAAIVSRELKIPCVIGTKIATKVLKTVDLVEVNASHGLVKILK